MEFDSESVMKHNLLEEQKAIEADLKFNSLPPGAQRLIEASREVPNEFKIGLDIAEIEDNEDTFLPSADSPSRSNGSKKRAREDPLKRTLPKNNTKIMEVMLRWWRQPAESGSQGINEHSGVERPRLGECLDVLVPQSALASNSPLYSFPF
ncbi:hypothetical protein LINGRAHAP2_LOCUS20321 [Linum grandiflorum]